MFVWIANESDSTSSVFSLKDYGSIFVNKTLFRASVCVDKHIK